MVPEEDWYSGQLLVAGRCVDCDLAERDVLEYDHVGTKTATVMKLAWDQRSLAVIASEIANCEIRCASCHRRRTAEMGGHYRYVAS